MGGFEVRGISHSRGNGAGSDWTITRNGLQVFGDLVRLCLSFDDRGDCLDAGMGFAELLGQQQNRQARRRGKGCLTGQGHQSLDIVDSLGHYNAERAQMGADRVAELGLLTQKGIAGPVCQYHRLLILGFDRDKPHAGSGDRFTNRFCVNGIVRRENRPAGAVE